MATTRLHHVGAKEIEIRCLYALMTDNVEDKWVEDAQRAAQLLSMRKRRCGGTVGRSGSVGSRRDFDLGSQRVEVNLFNSRRHVGSQRKERKSIFPSFVLDPSLPNSSSGVQGEEGRWCFCKGGGQAKGTNKVSDGTSQEKTACVKIASVRSSVVQSQAQPLRRPKQGKGCLRDEAIRPVCSTVLRIVPEDWGISRYPLQAHRERGCLAMPPAARHSHH